MNLKCQGGYFQFKAYFIIYPGVSVNVCVYAEPPVVTVQPRVFVYLCLHVCV